VNVLSAAAAPLGGPPRLNANARPATKNVIRTASDRRPLLERIIHRFSHDGTPKECRVVPARAVLTDRRNSMSRRILQPVGAASIAPIAVAAGEVKLLGRSPSASVVINDTSLSRLHLRLTMTPAGRLDVEDLHSTNGTFVNDVPTERATLKTGDRLRLGEVELLVLPEEPLSERRHDAECDRDALFCATLEAFAKAVEARDPCTRGHSDRVTTYALALARELDLDHAACVVVRRAGMLHDIGKVGVPDAVLGKPGPLDAAERLMMQAHTTIGYNLLARLPFVAAALSAVRGHHERWDGAGYPDRLAGTSIDVYARLLSVADAYDAMTTDRVYRKALQVDDAVAQIRAGSGTQFDPDVVAAFDAIEEEFADRKSVV